MSGKNKPYDGLKVLEAAAAVKNGMSYKDAVQIYGVPRSTINDKVLQRYRSGKNKPGPSSVLSYNQEKRLADYVLSMSRIGYGLNKKELPSIVKSVLDAGEETLRSAGISCEKKFEDNLPSSTWVYRFLKRWPEIASRMPENLGHQRAYITEERIRNWFDNLEEFMRNEYKIEAREFFCAANASRVFNLDESGFPLAGTNGKLKILTNRGSKNVYKLAPDSKEQVTVLSCAAASGDFCKPYVIFPGVRPKFNFDGVDPNEFDVGCSPNGWISSDCFFGWLSNIFFPRERDTIQFPIILFMDGHTSHINIAVAEFCRVNNIILFCFPAHASHVMQPLVISVFAPLKKHWNASLNEFSRKKGVAMSRSHFFPVFQKAWKKTVHSPNTVISGFRKSGLVPFNSEAVDYSRIISLTDQEIINGEIPEQERIGMLRIFDIFQKNLTTEIQTQFKTRIENKYDLVDETDRGILWKCYRDMKTAVGCKYSETSKAQSGVALILQARESSRKENDANLVVNDTPQNIQKTPQRVPYKQDEPQPSTSGVQTDERKLPFDQWEYSPFKNHLKISDQVIITRKVTKTKRKTPPAISGEEYCSFLQKQQEEKLRKLREKEQRRKDRIKKGTKRKRTEGDEEEDNLEMVLLSDDDVILEQDADVCFACFGTEGWEVPELWIGCSGIGCDKWYHKDCLSAGISSMTQEELDNFPYFCCKICEKKSTSKK